MIDILFIVFPTRTNILSEISRSTSLPDLGYYDNALSSAHSAPKIPPQVSDSKTLSEWCSNIKSGHDKLFISISLQRPDTGYDYPQWADADQWPNCLRQLMLRSKKIIVVTTERSEFIHNKIKGNGSGIESYDRLNGWYNNLHTSLTTVLDFSLGNCIRVQDNKLDTQTEIDKINDYTGQSFRPIVINSPEDKNLRKAIERKTPPSPQSTEITSKKVGSCQILTILDPALSTWIQYRGEAIKKTLSVHGISHDWTYNSSLSTLHSQIASSNCSVVINELWATPSASIRKLATEFPKVRFVNMNHSAPSFTASLPNPTSLSARLEMMEEFDYLASAYPNVFNGTVMSTERFELNGSKIISLPNLVRSVNLNIPRTPDPSLLSLSLVARFCPFKNLGGQIAAVRKVAKIKPVSLLLVTTFNTGMERYVRGLREAGVITTTVEWGDWSDLINLIGLYSDIGLQVSLTESLNLVALEHMMLGKPVVGSPAIEYLPTDWQANPQDPDSIADVILNHAHNLEQRGHLAKQIAGKVQTENNTQFIKTIQTLLNS